jgi:uncharacterized protein YndB with AHSA1/START domain
MNDVQIANEDLGHIEQITGYVKATLTRRLDHPAVKVWAMLTESSHIKDWLAPGEIELTKGGRAKLNFGDSGIIIDSEVSECETNQLLEYSWSNSKDEPRRPIRWSLEPESSGTKLTLTIKIPEDEVVDRSCAGWEAHLTMLQAAIEGVPIKFPFEHFQESRAGYKKLLGIEA